MASIICRALEMGAVRIRNVRAPYRECSTPKWLTEVNGRVATNCTLAKCVKVFTGSDKNRSELVRACDMSMLYAFAFARNTLTHFVITSA